MTDGERLKDQTEERADAPPPAGLRQQVLSWVLVLAGLGYAGYRLVGIATGPSEQELVEQAREGEPADRALAILRLGYSDSISEEGLRAIADGLRDEDADVRRDAALALYEQGPAAAPVKDDIVAALREGRFDDRQARQLALHAAVKMGAARDVTDELKALAGSDTHAATLAVEWLAEIDGPEGWQALVEVACPASGEQTGVARWWAWRKLEEWSDRDDAARRYIEQAVAERGGPYRHEVLESHDESFWIEPLTRPAEAE